MKIEAENVYVGGFLICAAKKYAGRFVAPEGPAACKLKVRGFECVKRSGAPFVADAQRELLTMLVMERASAWDVEHRARQYVAFTLQNMQVPSAFPPPKGKYEWPFGRAMPLAKVTYSTKLSRPLHAFETDEPHVRAAKMLAAAGHEVQPGDRVHFVYVAHSDSARAAGAFPVQLLKDEALDLDYYFEMLKGTLERTLAPVLRQETNMDVFRVRDYPRLRPSGLGVRGTMLQYLKEVPKAAFVAAATMRRPTKTAKYTQTTLQRWTAAKEEEEEGD